MSSPIKKEEAWDKPFSLLTLNGGSSSIRFSCYEKRDSLRLSWSGSLSRIGQEASLFTLKNAEGVIEEQTSLHFTDEEEVLAFLLKWLREKNVFSSLQAIGHRVVYGMERSHPERITPKLLEELHEMIPYDPEHLPREISLMKIFHQHYPNLLQVACFDSAFHQTMPSISRLLPIPRRYEKQGIRRYGFHGLSYAFLQEELCRIGDSSATQGRVILAHLGSGASMAALYNGRSIDTSMGFTPSSGLIMSSRSGDLDPGLFSYLARTEGMSAEKFQTMITHDSGLIGISETTADMHDLLQREEKDHRAAEAVALFCYQAKKWIGAFVAALGGIDTLVFSGGIGENSSIIRKRICEGLTFLGIELEEAKNEAHAKIISSTKSRVVVRVIPTNEEAMIAKMVCQTLNPNISS